MSVYDDLRAIEAGLGLPRGVVRAVERRANGDFALVLKRPRPGSLPDLSWPWPILGRRVLRVSRRAVYGKTRRWRSRNRPFREWAENTLGYRSPAARFERMDRDDEVLDELRRAILRAAPQVEADRWWREQQRRRPA